MTALQLFLYILLGASLQIALFALVAVWRHFRAFGHMQKRMAGFNEQPPPSEPVLENLLPEALGGKPHPWKGERAFKVVRREFEDENRSVCSFYLQPLDGGPLPAFQPGQFLTFQISVRDPQNGEAKSVVRCYSLSDRPGLDHYRVSIKRVPAPADKPGTPPGLVSNHFHDNVHKGDLLSVRAPSGHFYLERDTSPVVLIAGGIGITPLLSMLNDTLLGGVEREVWLFYGVRNSADHAMKKHLEELAQKHFNFRLHVCYMTPLPTDRQGVDYRHQGVVSVTLLRQTLSYQMYDFYICGPRPMMESLIPALEEWGVPDQHIHYEAFGPASISRATRKAAPAPAQPKAAAQTAQSAKQGAPAKTVKVTFKKSGKTLVWDGRDDTLLDFAERHGIEVSSGCRAGGCGSCQTEIAAGEVAYTQAPDFDADDGCCLLCVSRPAKDLTLEA